MAAMSSAVSASAPAPFLKWAGGKRALLPHLLELAPARIRTYYEPFLGGGALFFALARERRFERAVLADSNAELIGCYRAIQSNANAVIRHLERHPYDERHYYKVRDDLDPKNLSAPERAARLIYLNRAGYNGLYRVNRTGQFNVPFGRHRRPRICDPARLKAVAAALANVELVAGDFEPAVATARPGDFVYFDPPYVPISATSSFTGYAQKGFNLADQERLAALLRDLMGRGVAALLSNSDCPTTRSLYDGLHPRQVSVRRPINSVAGRRGAVGELLVGVGSSRRRASQQTL